MNCQRNYGLQLNDANHNGLGWLVRTLQRIIGKGERHRSYQLATQAAIGFHEICTWAAEAERLLHEKDDKIDEQDDKIDELKQQVKDLNAWVKSLQAIIADEKAD